MALRKKSALRSMREPAKDEELLMFGYQCNVFRDDEKALFIDQGKHLIPWNGDDTIMIDRYDVRACLSDLTEYDTDVIRRRHEPLTEKERHLEALLDEERYLELRTDVTEKMMYEEEEMKRLNEALAGNSYGAVGFNYMDPANSTEAVDGDEDQASLTYDPPYTVIPGLPLPPDMTVPATMKVHAIIEKTASFVSKQGVQMEIILKTKQKNNQQFEFLNYDNELNPYYRHLVRVIKQGKYQPAPPPLVQQESEEHNDSHSYLHPSLTSAEIKEPEPSPITSQEFLESIQSKLPAGQIANTSYAILLSNLKKHANVVVQRPADSHQASGQSTDSAKIGAAPPPPPPPVTSQSQPLLSSADASPVNYREESPEGEQEHKHKKRSRDASDQSPCKPENKRKKDLVHSSLIIPPPPDQQPIIDKMADYVARNGPEFEMVVKMKKDERFRFLDSDHIHHNYYQYKKQIFLKEMEAQKVEEANREEEQMESGCEVEPKTSKSNDGETVASTAEATEKDEADDKIANVSKAVSFSIKTKEEEVTSLKTRTALLYESSGEEDEEDTSGSEAASLASRSLPQSLSRSSLTSLAVDKRTGNSEELGKKQAEQKLADRLAAAAREKLARESKERQLQAQRKRKAAMFISMLKDIDGAAPSSGPGGAGTAAPVEDVATDVFDGSFDSPFGSSLASRSVTPTLFLDQVTSSLAATVMSVQPVVSEPTANPIPATVPPSRLSHSSQRRPRSRSRDRSRHSKRHRKHSNTPPTAYTMGRRPTSKSPTSSRHPSHSQSKHKLKHSQVRSTSHSHAESKSRRKEDVVDHKRKSRSRSSDRKLKKESGLKKSSNKSHKKKSSKDPGTSHRHKSKKHKSKSKHRRSLSSSPDDQQPSKRSKSTVDRNNPDIVDLTGSPRAEDIGGRFAY